MLLRYLPYLFLVVLQIAFAAKADVNIDYRLEASMSKVNNSSLLSVAENYQLANDNTLLHEFLLSTNEENFRLLLTGYVSQVDANYTNEIELKELAYDFHLANHDWSVGKKVISWGVGYGFRPLDIVQKESRLTWQSLSMEGVPMISMEAFYENISDSWIVHRRQEIQIDGRQKYQAALSWQHYRLLNEMDIYSIAQIDEAADYKLGSGFSRVTGDHLEWHGSFLFLSGYEKFIRDPTAPLIASTDPYISNRYHDGVLALLGASWTWSSGISMMLEAWYDEQALSQDEWQSVFDTSNQQRALLTSAIPKSAIYNNINWNSREFRNSSLVQENILLRLSYEGEKIDPAFFVLWSVEDNGFIINLDFNIELNSYTKMSVSWRGIGGESTSVYANLPQQQLLAVGFTVSELW